jgi:hypothetical protein
MNRNSIKRIKLLAWVLAILAMTIPALASSAQVTSGDFNTYAAGIGRGYDIGGHATMTRTADGKTLVSVHVSGLAPNTSYGVHVHNKACNDASAGGHYMQDPAGPVDPYNEIWPVFTTNPAGIGNGNALHAFRARPEAQAVVVHDTDGARIACADLTD